MAGAAPEPDWIIVGGLGLLALDFSALALFRLTFLGLCSEEGVRTYVFHMLRTYVMILCNRLIL